MTIHGQMHKLRQQIALARSNAAADDIIAAAKAKAENLRQQVADTWTEEKNQRRCDLIDKEIAGTLTVQEESELSALQDQMRAFRRKFAPLPIAEAKALHDHLKAQLAAAATEGAEDEQAYAALKASVARITRDAIDLEMMNNPQVELVMGNCMFSLADYCKDVCGHHDIEIPEDSDQ